MTIQPVNNPTGFVSDPEVPDLPVNDSGGFVAAYNQRIDDVGEPYVNVYTDRTRPRLLNPGKMWGKNGFYMNGPQPQPFIHSMSQNNALEAQRLAFADPSSQRVIKDYNLLLSKYGNTNSPGVLYAMAMLGITDEDEVAQGLLKEDATVEAEDYANSAPVKAGSPMANNALEQPTYESMPSEDGTLGIWRPLQFASRNVFSALQMPVEGIQGAIRTIGGAMADEEASVEERLGTGVAALAAVANPIGLITTPIIDGLLLEDNEFVNPWEQTEFGQTLLNFASGAGIDAFTENQAGLDLQRARKDLLNDPEYMATLQVNDQGEPDEQGLAKLNQDTVALAKEKNYYSQAGWFIDETSKIGEAQRQETFRAWAIPGEDDELTAWTMGRGIASSIGGPDWEAYNVVSGLIDAVAMIGMDPLTYSAGLGLPSKVVKGVSGVARGFDNPILIGKELRKAQERYGITARNLENARQTVNQMRKDAGDVEPPITSDQMSNMSLLEQADLVRQAKIAELTDEIRIGVEGDYATAAKNEKDIRKAQGQIVRVNNAEPTKPAPDVAPEKIEDDIVRLFLDGEIEDDIKILEPFTEATGTVTAKIPTKQEPTYAVVDGVETISYWTGRQKAVVANADDLVPDNIKARIVSVIEQRLDEMDNPRANPDADPLDELLENQVSARMLQALDPRENIRTTLSRPDVTYGDLYRYFAAIGLDDELNFALRTGRRGQRIDGIQGLNLQTGKGVWFGDNPNIASYSVDPQAMANGRAARMVDDPEDYLANAERLPYQGSRVDIYSLSPEDYAARREALINDVDMSRGKIERGMESAKINAQRLQVQLNERIAGINAKFGYDEATGISDPISGLRQTIGYHAGLRNSVTGGLIVDETKLRRFLFGIGAESKFANEALDIIADFVPQSRRTAAIEAGEDSDVFRNLYNEVNGEITLATNNKWSPETYDAVTRNAIYGGGRNGLIDILAPRIGIDVTKGDISRTVKLLDSDQKTGFRSWRDPSLLATRALRKISMQMPTARLVNLDNSSEVIDAITLYARYAGLQADDISRIVGNVNRASGTVEHVGVNRNALLDTFDLIAGKLINELDTKKGVGLIFSGKNGAEKKAEIVKAIQDSTALYLGGRTKERKYLEEAAAANDDVPFTISAGGDRIENPSILLDTELAQGFISLPSVDEWLKATNRFVMAMSRTKVTESGYKLARRFYDNFFRTSMLVFRIAYIARNVGEMQVRMFMNGHQSIFSDPMTMVGMTFGTFIDGRKINKYDRQVREFKATFEAEQGRPPKKSEIDANVKKPETFADLYKPYSNTILDTKFEAGEVEQIAAANHVEDYFNLIRRAHSLTDPRVYNNAVRRGWVPVQWGASEFFDGWAHELIMLERSDIARYVVGGPPKGFYGQSADLGSDTREVTLDFFMGQSDEALKIKSLMIGADPKFRTIFADRALLKDYLFDNVNSVYNRVLNFTGNDPRLMAYIKTGVLYHGKTSSLNLRSFKTPEERLKKLANVLRSSDEFNNPNMASHFQSKNVEIFYTEKLEKRDGISFFNMFFDFANKIERIGAVGPEYRMAYWDRIAELAPGIRAKDIDRAMKAAETTLSPIQRLVKDKPVNVGRTHPAFKALEKAKNENTDGLMTLDEIHGIASQYAAEVVSDLFYDAAKRSNYWYALRLLFPFGQAWGNTITKWTELGAKNPIQVYKAQRAFNALTESGSSAIYDLGEGSLYAPYAPGGAPWDADPNGGFFYTNQYGDTSFTYPLLGRMAGVVPFFMGQGFQDIPIESPAQSLNLALGADSIFPGISAVGAMPLRSNYLPDSEITDTLRQIATPFGERSLTETIIPAWLAKSLGGVGSIPVVGDVFEGMLDGLAPGHKHRFVKEAQMILASSGNYPDWATNDETKKRLEEDANGLAKALLFTTGLVQNFAPSTPIVKPAAPIPTEEVEGAEVGTTGVYTIGLMNTMFQQYVVRNGFDRSAAAEEWVADFGPTFLYATIGDWKNLSRVPKSDALKFARMYPEIARSNVEDFTLFFPNGDASDLAAYSWINKYGVGDRVRKNGKELSDEVVNRLVQVQRLRINFKEANGMATPEQAKAMREELKERYRLTLDTSFLMTNTADDLKRINALVDKYEPLAVTNAGIAFKQAWRIREKLLEQIRAKTGDPSASLGSERAATMREYYFSELSRLEQEYPDFRLLSSKMRDEWED